MGTATRTPQPEPSFAEMRRLTLRGCEAARLSAAAAAEGIGGGQDAPLDVVREREEELDALDRQLNEGVTYLISRVPEADARELLSCLKMIIELERVGDLLLNFANRARTVVGRIDEQDVSDLKQMATLLEHMLVDAGIAFRDRDLKRAIAILRTDAQMDRIRNLMFVRHIDNPENRPRHESFHLLFMTQNLERAGDHTKNMAEEVCHLVTGRSVRHLMRQADKSIEEMFVEHLRRQNKRQ
jgi:phosphate transport system protein